MTIIAEFTIPAGKFGLTHLNIFPILCPDDYIAIFSVHGKRSNCQYYCTKCPLDNKQSVQPCFQTPEHFLPIFGITQESHPEYFI